MNPPNNPRSYYKNILPSEKFVKVLGALAVIALIVFLTPKLIKWITSYKSKTLSTTSIVATVPSGDPTTRDSSGTGIPDWELIAAGIDPTDPNAAAEFQKIKTMTGAAGFQIAAENASDSDKLGLVVYNDLSQDALAAGSTSTDTVSDVTAAEVANYISAQQAKNKTYALSDLTVSDDTNASIDAYYTAMAKLGDSPFDQTFVTHLTAYIQGTETKSVYISAKLATIDQMVTTLLAIPVPPTAEANHLAVLNALYGLEQTIDNYDPATNDNLSQLGTVGLAEDYIRSAITAAANITEYFSVAVDPNSSSK